MRRYFPIPKQAFAALLFALVARSQSVSGVVIGAGYSLPTPIKVAPGQVITIFAQGLHAQITEPVLSGAVAATTSLRGISAVLHITGSRKPVALPILALRRVSTCTSPAPDCAASTAVTVQLPYNIPVNRPGSKRPDVYSGILSIVENGIPVPGIVAVPVPDSIHVLSGCDVGVSTTATCNADRIVHHLNGTQVTHEKPAAPSEELVLYAFGAGVTSPVAPAGVPTPEGVYSTRRSLKILFDFQPNVGASACAETTVCPFVEASATLLPGSVGLYEIRFKAPVPPAQASACAPTTPGMWGVASNLTVTVVGATSFDAAPICVSVR